MIKNLATRAAGTVAGIFGAGGLTSKLLLTGGYVGAGALASAYIGKQADMKRAYYGESRYNSYYGNGAENLAGVASGVGMFFGTMALLGRDPVSRLRGSYRYWRDAGLGRLDAGQGVSQFAGRSGRSLLQDPGVSQTIKAKISSTPRMGMPLTPTKSLFKNVVAEAAGWARQGLTYAAMGGSVAYSPEVIGYGAGGAALIMGGAGLLKLNKKTGLPILGSFASTTAAIGAGVGTAHYVNTRKAHQAAEGNIVGFSENNVIERMNWSTAGLVQALHRNRKIGV